MKQIIREYENCPKCDGRGATEPEDGMFCGICNDVGRVIKKEIEIGDEQIKRGEEYEII